jgi:uncharacterized protein (TIGR03083 family)
MAVLDTIRDERLQLVERLQHLTPEQWRTPSLCAGWTVQDVLAHLTTPFLVSKPAMMLRFLRHRGIDRAMDVTARELGRREPAELLETLRSNAGSAFRPPGMPRTMPLTDVVCHGADIRWALGEPVADWGDPQRLRPVLDLLVSPLAAAGFVPPGRLKGLRLVAEDSDWSHGDGAEVRGPSLPLAMAVLGRPAAGAAVTGPGVQRLLG